MKTTDEEFMKIAIEEAKKTKGEYKTPYAALIVKDGKIIAKAHNEVKKNLDPTCHAEVSVIRKACKILKTRDLSGCILYATCESCPMCFSAAWWANILKIVYGAAIGDATKGNRRQIEITTKTLNKQSGNKIKIKGNVLRSECIKLFKR
jgi:tRNA(Arg) A34 adenosine deaminase TadA